jgi:hypothetical protein
MCVGDVIAARVCDVGGVPSFVRPCTASDDKTSTCDRNWALPCPNGKAGRNSNKKPCSHACQGIRRKRYCTMLFPKQRAPHAHPISSLRVRCATPGRQVYTRFVMLRFCLQCEPQVVFKGPYKLQYSEHNSNSSHVFRLAEQI